MLPPTQYAAYVSAGHQSLHTQLSGSPFPEPSVSNVCLTKFAARTPSAAARAARRLSAMISLAPTGAQEVTLSVCVTAFKIMEIGQLAV